MILCVLVWAALAVPCHGTPAAPTLSRPDPVAVAPLCAPRMVPRGTPRPECEPKG